jgi:hypothetical protein
MMKNTVARERKISLESSNIAVEKNYFPQGIGVEV